MLLVFLRRGGDEEVMREGSGSRFLDLRFEYVRVNQWLWNSIGYDRVKSWLLFSLNACG